MKEAGGISVAQGAEEGIGSGVALPRYTAAPAVGGHGSGLAPAAQPTGPGVPYQRFASTDGVAPAEERAQQPAIVPAGAGQVGPGASAPLPDAWGHPAPAAMRPYFLPAGGGLSAPGAAMVPMFGPNMMGRAASFPHPMMVLPGHVGQAQRQYPYYAQYPPVANYAGSGHAPHGYSMMPHAPPSTGLASYMGAALSNLPFKPALHGSFSAQNARGGVGTTAPAPAAHVANMRGGHLWMTGHVRAPRPPSPAPPPCLRVASTVTHRPQMLRRRCSREP